MEADKPFPWNKDDLIRYKLIQKEKLYKCDMCENNFKHRSSLAQHKKEHSIACDLCEKAFTQRSSLSQHKRIHTGERLFACDLCEKSFNDRSNLGRHKRIRHTGSKLYSSHLSHKSLTDRSALLKHNKTAAHIKRMKDASSTNPNNFVDCGEAIKVETIKEEIHEMESVDDPKPFPWNKNDLIKYKLIQKEKLYKCDMCEKNYKDSRSLAQHKNDHTSEKLYECDSCKKTFTQRSRLTQHKRIHTGEKHFACDLCEKSFNDRSNLGRHKRIRHAGSKLYSCNICQKSFTERSSLLNHNKTAAHIKRINRKPNDDSSTNSNNFVDCCEAIKVEAIKEEINEMESIDDPLSIEINNSS